MHQNFRDFWNLKLPLSPLKNKERDVRSPTNNRPIGSMNKSILLQQSFDTNQSKILNRNNVIDDKSSEEPSS